MLADKGLLSGCHLLTKQAKMLMQPHFEMAHGVFYYSNSQQ
jgi:hypothetical protein